MCVSGVAAVRVESAGGGKTPSGYDCKLRYDDVLFENQKILLYGVRGIVRPVAVAHADAGRLDADAAVPALHARGMAAAVRRHYRSGIPRRRPAAHQIGRYAGRRSGRQGVTAVPARTCVPERMNEPSGTACGGRPVKRRNRWMYLLHWK